MADKPIRHSARLTTVAKGADNNKQPVKPKAPKGLGKRVSSPLPTEVQEKSKKRKPTPVLKPSAQNATKAPPKAKAPGKRKTKAAEVRSDEDTMEDSTGAQLEDDQVEDNLEQQDADNGLNADLDGKSGDIVKETLIAEKPIWADSKNTDTSSGLTKETESTDMFAQLMGINASELGPEMRMAICRKFGFDNPLSASNKDQEISPPECATSNFEDMVEPVMNVDDDANEEDVELNVLNGMDSEREPERETKRAQDRKAEKPQWVSPPITGGAKGPKSTSANHQLIKSSWPQDIEIVACPGKRDLPMKQQTPRVASLLAEMIASAALNIWTDQAIMAIEQESRYYKNLAVQVCEDMGDNDVAQRLQSDMKWANHWVKTISARVQHERSKFGKEVTTIVETSLRLVPGCEKHVDKLLSEWRYMFKTKNGSHGVDTTTPYQTETLIKVVGAAFEQSKLLAKCPEACETSIPDDPTRQEPEAPLPMVAYAATLTRAIISRWKTGVKEAAELKMDVMMPHYLQHVQLLEKIRDGNIRAYHRMMACIFTGAHGTKAAEDIPLLDINIDEMPEY